jgi:hypothetical protein
MISCGDFVSRMSGNAVMPASSAKSSDLPSMTGIAAAGPMFPRPSTADPSVTIATAFARIVSAQARSGSSAMARQIRATPGVYTSERSSRVRTETRPRTSIFPPRCMRKARSDTARTFTPSIARSAAASRRPVSSSGVSTVTSRTWSCGVASTRSIAPSEQPCSPITRATCANIPGRFAISSRKMSRCVGVRTGSAMRAVG